MLDAVSKDIPFSIKTLLILLISAFFVKNQHFLANTVPFHKARVWELCLRFSSSIFNFCKVTVDENIRFTGYASGIELLDCSKLAINWNTMASQFSGMRSLSKFFDIVLFLLSSLVTGPNFISILSLVLELWLFLLKAIDQKSGN